MIFRSKYERAVKRIREQNADSPKAFEDGDLESKLEKGDMLAMILSALIVLVPIALVALAVVAAAGYFFIVR